ncbi:MAG: AAA domain-containing protein [Thermodesulfobacteriota bacterium]|nr:AAA domain-containing protein [Thermodesulfobacteriota bacterium]
MALKDKAQRLFEFISQVYAIDLPINRDITQYGDELWWQADIVTSRRCEIRAFDGINGILEPAEMPEATHVEDVWLSVTKRAYDDPPILPSILQGWIDVSSNPTRQPSPKPSILKATGFDEDARRVAAFSGYVEALKNWNRSQTGKKPDLPETLSGWVDEGTGDSPPIPISRREFEEKFENDKNRSDVLSKYLEGPWKFWSERVLPQYRANILYDRLFDLYQRLSVEGDRLEVIWGHLFLTWNHSPGSTVYHPLIITPLNLHYDPMRRNIALEPNQTTTTKLDLDCLTNLDYPLKEQLIKFSRIVNNDESPPDPWNNNQMRGYSTTITGYLSKESAEKSDLYSDEPVSRPPITSIPTVHNAPAIFVRQRPRRFWVDDAEKVAAAIHGGSPIPPFIRSLIADPHAGELPNPDDYADDVRSDDDEAEHLLPLEYNDQQEEIVKRLRNHFGALVQGPPGTGKSHTIANIISSFLARGKKILVTTQTENALRVLREFIPDQVRSLCVSHIGNDTESKKQLGEAVESIGKHLSEKNSQVVEQRIQRLKRERRAVREEQSGLRSQIKEWRGIGFSTIPVGGETINAVYAAKECAERKDDHGWLPDNLLPESNPPLTEQELREMCNLLKEISPEDRKSCLQILPEVVTPEAFSKMVAQQRYFTKLAVETDEMRSEWGDQIKRAECNFINEAQTLLENALRSIQALKQPWQLKILRLISVEANQDVFWHDFLKQCRSSKEIAWKNYNRIKAYRVVVKDMPPDLDIDPALEELSRIVGEGGNPSKWLTRITMSKEAKLIFSSIKVDNYSLLTSERIDVAKAYFQYKRHVNKIKTIWEKNISIVEGPKLALNEEIPLAEIDERMKDISAPLEWKDQHLENIRNKLRALGCRKQDFHEQKTIEEYLKILNGQIAEIEGKKIEKDLSEYRSFFEDGASREGTHFLWKVFASAVSGLSVDKYEETHGELFRLRKLCGKVEKVEGLSTRLRNVAPIWHSSLEKRAVVSGEQALEKDWAIAWRWRRLNEWLNGLHKRESVESLQNCLERAREKERELITQLVIERTWQRQIANIEDYHYRALTAWAQAMRRYGRTGGKFGQRWLLEASKAMVDAVGAVPAWIMPLHRVVMSFPAEPEIFDLAIVDEASQCDLRALPVLFRAKKVLVVGDPEQISPSAVGIDRGKIFELNKQFLSDVPYAGTTFLIDNSLYHIAQSIPRMDRILLTEHFRCLPEIIEFNNRLCPTYAGKLEPLRQPNPHQMLKPTIGTIFVNNGFKDNNDVNKPEAEALVETLIKCCKDNRYLTGGKRNGKRTMGVISLLGEKQAKYISDLIAQQLEETERAERRIICGDAYAFQGDERDVMFLSMVVADNAQFAPLVKDSDRQRFNVATSRARDQVFLFHSLKLDSIKNPECVRYRLLEWYSNPPMAEMQHGIEVLRQKAESEFEIGVGEGIIKRGYKVIPQFKPLPNDFNYRIDLVIQGEKLVGIECDGEKYHGPERWEYDQRREAQLRRAGWKFWRISGSAFYRDKEKAMEGLWKFLEDEGITPKPLSKVEPEGKQAMFLSEQDKEQESLSSSSHHEKSTEEGKHGTLETRNYKATKQPNEEVKKDGTHPWSNDISVKSIDRVVQIKEFLDLFNDWKIWQNLISWGESTGNIDSHSRAIGYQIVDRLKLGRKFSPWLRKEMETIWKTAIKKGFKPEINLS